jgi:hypothetical protein
MKKLRETSGDKVYQWIPALVAGVGAQHHADVPPAVGKRARRCRRTQARGVVGADRCTQDARTGASQRRRDDGARHLAASLGRNTHGASPRPQQRRDDGARHLAAALERNTSLATLKLGEGRIGAEGARHLAAALGRNTTLTALHLGENIVGDNGARHLAAALERNTTLEVLDLSSNKIGTTELAIWL